MAETQQPGASTMNAAKDAARQALVPSIVGLTTEIAPTAGAAQVQAMVQARFVMALKQPRNLDTVRQDLLKECRRPEFALEEKEGEGNSALYRRPVGGGKFAEGLGIRFAEVAVRCMRNLMVGALTIQEDEFKKTKYCFAIDLETNDSWEDTIDISKTVERAQPRQGDEVIKQRVNSRGIPVFTIVANEDALTTKEAAAISKKLRTLVLRLIPGDFQDECIRTIREIRTKRIFDDPDAAKKRVIDGMFMQNVTVTMLEDYLGHPVAQCTPAEIMNLQGLYGALRDGITTWKDVMDNIEESRKVKPAAEPATATPTAGMEGAKAAEAATATQAPTQPVVQPQQTAAPAAPPPTQPVAAQTVAETPAVAQQTVAPPAQPPAVQQPAQTPPPAPAPVQTAPPATAGGPPDWTQETAAPAATVAPPAQVVTPPATAAPPAQSALTNINGIWTLSSPMKRGPGKIVKDVQFPAVLTRNSDAEAWTADQLARAQVGLDKVNGVLGKTFKLESTVKNWFGADLNALTSQAMDCVIQVLENWK